MNSPQVYMCSPSWTLLPPRTIPLGRPSAPAPSIQYHASNLDWWFVSYMILYMFQCHSPKSSHPLPLPQSSKDCSIHLCLFCYLAYRVILIPCYARHCLDPWVAYSWARALLCFCLVISIFIAGHIHYVSRVLALLLYKHCDTAIRDCIQMKKLSLRQTKSLFFFCFKIIWLSMLLNPIGEPEAQWGQRNRKVWFWSGESFTAGPCRRKGRLLP